MGKPTMSLRESGSVEQDRRRDSGCGMVMAQLSGECRRLLQPSTPVNQLMEREMDVAMSTVRKQSLAFFGLALLAAFVAFLMLFVGRIDHFLATGVSVLALIAFVLLFNRAWTLWEQAHQVLDHG
ncbi:hypothetical protein FAZ69_08490 [Trinickia terrae]|uniref:Uncharacterized protein n=1 Tax=Trinickia terrae TaxID=2571161 RepID=A0A4U1IA09_9BURK|nr:hypothetical protein [Trinickia terrae]TKC90175.1 hypothetical protein FAZ69_08490 [Trinickia terrae]